MKHARSARTACHHQHDTQAPALLYVDTQTHVAEGEAVTNQNPVLARRDTRRVRDADVVFLETGRERQKGFDVRNRAVTMTTKRKKALAHKQAFCAGVSKVVFWLPDRRQNTSKTNAIIEAGSSSSSDGSIEAGHLEPCHTVCHLPLPLAENHSATSSVAVPPHSLFPLPLLLTLSLLPPRDARGSSPPSPCAMR